MTPDIWIIDRASRELLLVPDDTPLVVVRAYQSVTVPLMIEEIDVNAWALEIPVVMN